jgi:ketosteroid isomerase-like protein
MALTLGLLTTLTVQSVAPAQDDAARVAQLERSLVKAIGSQDLATYDRLVADDYIVIRANGRDSTKAEVMATYRAGALSYAGLEIADVKAHVFGDTAVVSARTLGTRKEDGKEVPNRVRYVRVFARRGGEWRAVSQMAAPVQEP